MPLFDLDEDQPLATGSAAPKAESLGRVKITWTTGGTTRTLFLLPFAVVQAGRLQSQQICLRVEPTTDQANLMKSKQISSHQFTLRYLGDRVEIVDPGSTNGIFVGTERLATGQPRSIDTEMTVRVAECLELDFTLVARKDSPADAEGVLAAAASHAGDSGWLQSHLVGAEKPGRVAFVKIARKNNRPDLEYALLFHAGAIGGGPDALIRLANENRPLPAWDFDLGGSSLDVPAQFCIRAGKLFLQRGSEAVLVAGRALEPGQAAPLVPPCEFVVGKTIFSAET